MLYCLYTFNRLKPSPSYLRTVFAPHTVPIGAAPALSRRLLSTPSMDLPTYVERLRGGGPAKFPADANSLDFARQLDGQDALRHLRYDFILPTKTSIKKKALDGTLPSTAKTNGATATNGNVPEDKEDSDVGIYFVGNSLGAQPKAIRHYIDAQLETWASIGVNGHFNTLGNSPLSQWQDMAEDCARQSAALVGASPAEVVVMNTLTVNLHMMMASFYKPDPLKRHKIILEWRPFPSDYYALESQVAWHGLDPATSMVKIEPDDENCYISTEKILATIDAHADDTALLLLPGIQYYSGQLLDMPTITAYARARGIVVGWDLAHAAGNVELRLHDWDVDFACWCTYKYINAGPGAIAGAFVHERHGRVEWEAGRDTPTYRPRLTGWYGGDKSVRFNMDNRFVPTPGAAGYQASNPSALELANLAGALSVFDKTSMKALRDKALVLTAYAEHLLDGILADGKGDDALFRIITPRDPLQRGTQLSVLLRDGLLDDVAAALELNGVLCDKRKPGVIRVAPVPLYSRFEDVWRFMQILRGALKL
ncbi:kynureninase [Cordyceps fumosorosea ARSEF 2679]|uniref:Kynureninase n=1 Tax=Cordyceps fumosorosea (strain ARSEF 2679) TaxID=1081104 RepID=A0A162MRL9_CORFA|nr:kynureninase [Cordyceps fumosorosea ARSEF 2679]OAA69139.1 kynureninase [Cordyceps fumosorosea ARSEF 2679]